ncbi:MAG: IS3 family transposase, partial [Campylobacterales bacterium]
MLESSWKRQFLENASLAFEPDKDLQEHKEEIRGKEKEIEELQKQLGKSVIEKEWLACSETEFRNEVRTNELKDLESSDKKSLVDSKSNDISVTRQCELLNISRSSYYYKPVPISEYNLKIMHTIDEIATDNSEYGYRFIHQELLENGFSIGKDRVLKYMQIMGIQAIYPTKKKLTSQGVKEHKKYQYLLSEYHNSKKQVIVESPNEVWSGDITYIRMNGGFMYLCAIIDWHSKAILSYKISNTMDAMLATDVLKEALEKYPKPKIFNSDQGSRPSEA